VGAVALFFSLWDAGWWVGVPDEESFFLVGPAGTEFCTPICRGGALEDLGAGGLWPTLGQLVVVLSGVFAGLAVLVAGLAVVVRKNTPAPLIGLAGAVGLGLFTLSAAFIGLAPELPGLSMDRALFANLGGTMVGLVGVFWRPARSWS